MQNNGVKFGIEHKLLYLFEKRTRELQQRLKDDGIDVILITNKDSI